MYVLYAHYPPHCCYFFYKGDRIYKVSKELGDGYTSWKSLDQITQELLGCEFYKISLKSAILRGVL